MNNFRTPTIFLLMKCVLGVFMEDVLPYLLGGSSHLVSG